jgi:hypothetical protein
MRYGLAYGKLSIKKSKVQVISIKPKQHSSNKNYIFYRIKFDIN